MSTYKNSKLKKRIISMLRRDQKIRKKWADSGFKQNLYVKKADKENQEKIKKIIKSIGGWPKLSEFGEEAADALWVLVQHSPNLGFQKRLLQEMQKLPKSEINLKNVAKTIDRIRLREGKKQLYGTSFRIDLQSGKLKIDPIYDKRNIDKRRKKMGLDSFLAHKDRAFSSYNEYLKNKHPRQ